MSASKKNNVDIDNIAKALSHMVVTIAGDIRDGVVNLGVDAEKVDEIVDASLARRTGSANIVLTKSGPKVASKGASNGKMSEKPLCSYILTRGPRAGNPCGKACTKNFVLCSTHKKATEGRGELVPVVPSQIREKFVTVPDNNDLYFYEGTNIVVTRKDYALPVNDANIEVLGEKDIMSDRFSIVKISDKARMFLEQRSIDITN
ncbi:hypothetical protein LPJ53_004513 [Coemansia erecta]|uniref:Uncharacterized protein n=1 Tax=Coemansia erecta TaxID=147472 RepID=A0A9W7XYR9_9FUNG|nr:hypothetical protein LPJ53_004513 [Coemansia erecta]